MKYDVTDWGGKGSIERPLQVSKEIYELRYTLAFGNNKDKKVARMKLVELGVLDEEEFNDK